MANFRDNFNKIVQGGKDKIKEGTEEALRNGAQDKIDPNGNLEKTREAGRQVKSVINNSKRIITGTGKLLQAAISFLTSPAGWVTIGILIIGFLTFAFMNSYGANQFDSKCPTSSTSSSSSSTSSSSSSDDKDKNDCKAQGDGSEKGRGDTEGGGFTGGSGDGYTDVSSYTGSAGVYLGKDQLPEEFKKDVKPINNASYPNSGYPRGQCTWFVWARARDYGGQFYEYLGNGGEWYQTGPAHGHEVTQTPTPHTAVSFPPGATGADPVYGHIAYVEAVAKDGSILISECNVNNLGESGIGWRLISASEAKKLYYVKPLPL